MLTGPPRVLVPSLVTKGQIFTIKALISHPMETGLRIDETGKIIPRKIINRFSCRYDGDIVFSADLFESVAANPYVEFNIKVTDNGTLTFLWEEDGGDSIRLTQNLVVKSS